MIRVPDRMLDAPVSDRAFRLACVLTRHANADGIAWLYRFELAEELDCSKATIDRAGRELEAAGLLRIEPTLDDDGGPGPNRWHIGADLRT